MRKGHCLGVTERCADHSGEQEGLGGVLGSQWSWEDLLLLFQKEREDPVCLAALWVVGGASP